MGLKFKPDGEQLKQFMRSDAFVRGLRGPVGSGKSVGCCVEIMRRALQQKPDAKGIRRSRWGVVRNTNPQLRTTTIKTWLDWFPEEEWGKFSWSPPFTHHIRKESLDLEVIFLALDKPEDVKKLLSLEFTGIFINEAREIPKAVIDGCTMRVNRYPSMKDGGATWAGVIMDTNAPEEDHWWPVMNGEAPIPEHVTREEALMLVKPADWEFYTQPEAMVEKIDKDGEVTGYEINPDAENLKYLAKDYYSKIIQGKTKSWIDVYVMNRCGTLVEGKPVYRDFVKDQHVAEETINAAPGVPLVIGVDFGLTPAAVFMQNVRGRWLVLRELVAFDMGATRFAQQIRYVLANHFYDFMDNYVIWGDPAGDFRAQTDETTPFQMLRAAGLTARPAPTNDVSVRLDSVTATLTRQHEGKAGLLIDPSCAFLVRGFEGGYHYRKLNVSGGERYDDKPEKDNKYSHVHDALQYGLCGGGEARLLMNAQNQPRPQQAKRRMNPFDGQRRKRRARAY